MKPIHFIPPALALAAVGLWLSRSWGELQAANERLLVLQRASSHDGDPFLADGSERSRRPPRDIPKLQPKIGWQRLSEIHGQPSKGIFAKLELRRAELLLREMTPEELLAALAEIAALDVDVRERWAMNEQVLTVLAAKDPVTLLDHLTSPGGTEVLSGNFTFDVFSGWAGKDPAAAIAWLDGKISSGDFTSKSLTGENHHRTTLEAAMLKVLIGSDAAAATARISALPEAQRAGIITRFNISGELGKRGFPDPSLTNYGALIRATLPADDQATAISSPIRSLAAHPGYGNIDGYLDEVAATPRERLSGVAATATTKFRYLVEGNRLNVEELDKFRAWAATQSPERADATMGSALAGLANNGAGAGAKAYELAVHYHGETGNDQILVSFMILGSSYGREKLLSLAERIKDPELRGKSIEELRKNPYMGP
ncbi:hypothetical protein OVA24_04175 [Luteolibacter sp. SL250]|uniref:hypothetical protein n=1 Tax=Luteolibacter sp. SL250 TaxID=2995170 RepID=UPI002271E994|nr:hypothetical protein [Luteolibacter sp. SL250]WAC20574.1 hypothetical protein OVA24_04175 [Luteolibacter sp. SL250]